MKTHKLLMILFILGISCTNLIAQNYQETSIEIDWDFPYDEYNMSEMIHKVSLNSETIGYIFFYDDMIKTAVGKKYGKKYNFVNLTNHKLNLKLEFSRVKNAFSGGGKEISTFSVNPGSLSKFRGELCINNPHKGNLLYITNIESIKIFVQN